MAYPIPIAIGSQYAFKGAMASAPSASAYPLGTHAFFTDVGLNGTDMVVSASGTWIPHNGRALLSRLTLPVVKAPTIPADASGTANGAITFGTAVGATFANCYCYFAANVVNATQPAGFYYMEMSSTTAAIVYNNTYTPASGTYPTEPTSKTAFAGAVPGGAGSTAEITAFISLVNANLMGADGCLIIEASQEATNNANSKTCRIKLGASTAVVSSIVSTANIHGFSLIRNIGSTSRQRSVNLFTNGTTGTVPTITTIDTTANSELSYTFQAGTATDWVALSCFNVNIEVA